jgi:hypothetical protein
VLTVSVGLVYLGFTRWVGIGLQEWWFDRRQFRSDLSRGVVGIALVLAATLGGTLALTALFSELASVGGWCFPLTDRCGGRSNWLRGELLLGWFFGFVIAAFQEETLFGGSSRGSYRSDTGGPSQSWAGGRLRARTSRVQPRLRVAAVPRRYRHRMARRPARDAPRRRHRSRVRRMGGWDGA